MKKQGEFPSVTCWARIVSLDASIATLGNLKEMHAHSCEAASS